jgi:hypothetical protein
VLCAIYFAEAAETASTLLAGTAPFTADAMALMSATSCASRLTLRPLAPAAAPAASSASMTTPRTANPARSMLAAWGLTRPVMASTVDSWLLLLQRREDARFYELRNLYRVARGGGKGMLHACNQCSHLFFSFSPLIAGDAVVELGILGVC